jgi:hypothetical protein
MCDRVGATPGAFAASQIGFIDAVVQPLLEGICLHLPSLRGKLVDNLSRSRTHWLRVRDQHPAPA